MRGQPLLVLGLERVQRVAGGERLEVGVVGVPCGPADQPSGFTEAVARAQAARSARTPASMRVFTVPSGAPVSAEISRCV